MRTAQTTATNPTAPRAVLYLDDGYPESRDYDDNYVLVEPGRRTSWWRALLGLPPIGPRATATAASRPPVGKPLSA